MAAGLGDRTERLDTSNAGPYSRLAAAIFDDWIYVMGRPELGTKCACASCAERFYDLNRVPAVCPKCGAQQPPEKPRVVRPSRSTVDFRRQTRQPVPVVAEDEVEA